MKPSKEDITLIAVLLAAIIAAHVFAPTAAATVVSMVTTLMGYFFAARLSRKRKGSPTSEEGDE